MGLNLTQYNACFKILDYNYDILNKSNKNIIDTSKETYENTKNFTALLVKHSNEYSSLTYTASRISALNEYFCSMLCEKTGINLDNSRSVKEVKESAQLSHQLAKMTVANLPEFINKINIDLKELNQELTLQSQSRLSEEKMDSVDTQLLTSRGTFYMEGSDAYNIGCQRLISTEKGFENNGKMDTDLFQIVKSLNKFVNFAQSNNYKIGF